MTRIVLGIGSSHGPLLSTPSNEWDLRANVDRANPALAYRGASYDFAALTRLRESEGTRIGFEAANAPAERAARQARCTLALDTLGSALAAARPDVLLIVGDDQAEWFKADIQPAFAIYHGAAILNRALTDAERADRIRRGNTYAMKVNYPDTDETYAAAPELGEHLVTAAIAAGFDVTACAAQPRDDARVREMGHAFAFIQRRIAGSLRVPLLPVFVNTYYPPNTPSASRCFAFGRALGAAIATYPGDLRVAVAASGGLSHFVIDEALDRRVLAALESNDGAALNGETEPSFRSGSSEIKNWITVAGMLAAQPELRYTLLDYVPCVRSEAGTGNAMAFALWR